MDFEKGLENIESIEKETIDFIRRCRQDVGDTPLIIENKDGKIEDEYSKIILKLQSGEITPGEAKLKAVYILIEEQKSQIFNSLGNNDTEYEFKYLFDEVKRGEKTPEEAVSEIIGTKLRKGDWGGGH